MERSISSDNGRDDPDFEIFCFCGEPAPLRISATQSNPGRRFFGCTKYDTREDCGFFCWYEPPVCQDRRDLGPMRVQTRNNKKKTLTDHSIWINLPPEIIDNVLSFLPVKFLCRLKCVSSEWNSLISSTKFETHRHITNNTPNKPQKSLLISSSHDFYSVNFAAVNPIAEKLDFGLTVRGPTALVHGWGSCNGLVLVCVADDVYDLFLFNPFIGECKKLPCSPFSDCSFVDDDVIANGFGYDSSADDYKVVMIRSRNTPPVNQTAVYSLRTDAWRRIPDKCYYVVPEDHCHGVFFNERLHWLCTNIHGLLVVLAFDLSDEIFRELELPTAFPSSYIAGTFEQRACVVPGSSLCLVISPNLEGSEIDVWMMLKYGVRESWTKFTIAPVMFLKEVLYLAAEEEFFLRMTEELMQPGLEKLVLYNPIQGTLRDLVVSGIPSGYRVGVNYFDTLVSPNHGGQILGNYEAT